MSRSYDCRSVSPSWLTSRRSAPYARTADATVGALPSEGGLAWMRTIAVRAAVRCRESGGTPSRYARARSGLCRARWMRASPKAALPSAWLRRHTAS